MQTGKNKEEKEMQMVKQSGNFIDKWKGEKLPLIFQNQLLFHNRNPRQIDSGEQIN